MKQIEIDRYREQWRAEVDRIAESGWYADEDRAGRLFDTAIAPLWKTALHLGEMPSKEVRKALGVTPTMQQVLVFFGICVLQSKAFPRTHNAPKLKRDTWPPYLHDGGLFFIPAVPKCDIARIIGKREAAVSSAIDRLRGKGVNSKLGTRLIDARLAFPAPFATGIMFDGGFDVQLSLPYAWKVYDYEQLGIYAVAQRRETGWVWTLTNNWAHRAKSALVGEPVHEEDSNVIHLASNAGK